MSASPKTENHCPTATPPTSPMASLNITPSTDESPKRANYLHWGDYFMATALLAAQRSKDPATQVGACIVDEENRIVAIGYNGLPRGCSDDEFPWSKCDADSYKDKKSYVVHAEANAILNKNSSNLQGNRLYTTLFPCNECAKLIIQSGIREIYFLSDEKARKATYRASRRMFDATGVVCKRFTPEQATITLDFDAIMKRDRT